MVDVNEDAMAVTMKIRRETRVAKERSAAERTDVGSLQLPPPIPSAEGSLRAKGGANATVAVPPASSGPERPTDPATAFRRAQMGVVAAVVLVLVLLWIRQRRR